MSNDVGKRTATRRAGKAAANKAIAKTIAKAPAQEAACRILSAPKGPRTLTHGEVKRAVKAVFKVRYGANA